MSAYIVDRGHIAYLVEAGRVWNVGATPGGRETETGQMLWDENIKSIQYRYPDTRENMDNAPGPIGETFEYEHRAPSGASCDPLQVLKSIACYGYQTCEHPGWKDSEAYAYCEALKDRAINRLEGYDACEWGAPKRWVEACRIHEETV